MKAWLWIIGFVIMYASTGNLAGSVLTVAMFWWFFGRNSLAAPDPDHAYGEVDSDGDFGN
jgi:hypothetical protein